MLEYFADRLGPFPYAKLAQVQSTIRYLGMENASAIFYAEAELQGPDVDEFPVAHRDRPPVVGQLRDACGLGTTSGCRRALPPTSTRSSTSTSTGRRLCPGAWPRESRRSSS